MSKRKPRVLEGGDVIVAIGVVSLVLYFFGGMTIEFLVEFPIVTGIVLVLIVLCAFSLGCFLGIGDSKKERAAAKTKLNEATSCLKESTALRNRNEAILKETAVLAQALRLRNLEDLDFIAKLNALPIQARVSRCIVVGEHGPHDGNVYQTARSELTEKRTSQWKEAKRFGQRLLTVVENQGGICGDPSKDPQAKGCGCYLYGLPPTAVHLDHIAPQSKGGQDNPENLQALCSACNVSAGDKEDKQIPLTMGFQKK